jgi:hypothetical protein
MSKVFTGNVFITTSRSAVDKAMNTNLVATLPDLLKVLDESELSRSVIASPSMNSNLLEFELSFNYEAQGIESLRLKMLETNSEFEKQYVNRSIVKENVEEVLKNISNFTTKANTTGLEPTSLRALESVTNKMKFLAAREAAESSTGLYFMFGVGSDISEWAGPYLVSQLQNAELNVTESGNREITLTFVNLNGQFSRNKVTFDDEDTFFAAANKFNFLIANKNVKIFESDVAKNDKYFVTNLKKSAIKIIKSYITKVSNGCESIVFLPSLEKIITKSFQENINDPTIFNERNPGQLILPRSSVTYTRRINIGKIITETLGMSADRASIRNFTVINPNLDVIQSSEELFRPDPFKLYGPPVIYDWQLSMKTSPDGEGEVIPDFFLPLKYVCDAIKVWYPQFSLYFYTESNLKLLQLWKKIGLINSDTKQVYVFGDKTLIQKYLYLADVTSIFDALEDYALDPYFDSEIRLLLARSNYRIKFLEIMSKGQSNSSFGENALKPDEMFYETTELQLQNSYTLKNPVFRHNIENSNVLSLSVKNNGLYTAAYNIAFRVKNLLPFLNFAEKYYADILKGFEFDYADEIKEFTNFVNDKRNKSENKQKYTLWSLLNDASEFNKVDIKLAELLALSLFTKENNGSKPFIEYNSSEEAKNLEIEFLENLNRLAFQVDIKTLPFFKISCLGDIAFKRASLVSMYNSISRFDNLKKPAYYSGSYAIKGYKHFMSAYEMYSEFSLINISYAESLRKSKE